jgi:hypothetical protein
VVEGIDKVQRSSAFHRSRILIAFTSREHDFGAAERIAAQVVALRW